MNLGAARHAAIARHCYLPGSLLSVLSTPPGLGSQLDSEV